MIDAKEIEKEKQNVQARIDELINNVLPFYRSEKSKNAEQGDLSENNEYANSIANIQNAEYELLALQHKQDALNNMGLDTYVPTGFVGIGSVVEIKRKDTGEQLNFMVVVPELGDASKGRLPTDSKLGEAILGKEAGDEVWVRTSARSYYADIVSVD